MPVHASSVELLAQRAEDWGLFEHPTGHSTVILLFSEHGSLNWPLAAWEGVLSPACALCQHSRSQLSCASRSANQAVQRASAAIFQPSLKALSESAQIGVLSPVHVVEKTAIRPRFYPQVQEIVAWYAS